MIRRFGLAGALLCSITVGALCSAPAGAAPFVYVNSYINRGRIWQYNTLASASEALTALSPRAVPAGSSPSGLAVSADGSSLYVGSGATSMLRQFSINPQTGKLKPKAHATVPSGAAPETVADSPNDRNVYAANLADNTISQYTISAKSGELKPLGSAIPTGGTPTGIAIAPNSRYVYVVDHGSSTVSQYKANAKTGALKPLSPATVSTGAFPDEIVVSPNGKSAYVTNLTDNTVSQYNLDPATGQLSPKPVPAVGTGNRPGGIAITPDGKSLYVVNSFDDTVSQYDVNRSGALAPKAQATVSTGLCPGDIAVTADGHSAYVVNDCDKTVSQYNVARSTGELKPKSHPTAPTGRAAFTLAITPFADAFVNVRAPTSVKSGSQLTYTVNVGNAGPSSAWQATLTDRLPTGTQLVRVTAARGHCSSHKLLVTCELGKIASGKHVSVAIKVTVKALHGELSDKAHVASVTPDPRVDNDADSANTKV
jgi:uncharacterized repeat protein (TIGR01451 family)